MVYEPQFKIRKDVFWAILFGVSIFCGLMLIGLGLLVHNSQKVSNISNLREFAIELNLEVIQFYKFNLSNTEKDLNESMLLLEGGVCHHYSKWYVNRSLEAGFFAEEFSFKTRRYIIDNKTYYVGHSIAIISDETGYCVLDGNNKPQCFEFKNNYSESDEELLKEILLEEQR